VRVGESPSRPSGQGHAPGGAVPPGAGRPPGGDPPLHDVLLATAPGPVLRSLRERLLSPVLDYDAAHNAELLSTLRAFLACDGSWSACASRMYVHVNTVRYRIGRIEELTGRDLSALPDRVDFFLALRGPGSRA
jgi:DNA-binding PucR family transcriptional regulator